MGRWEWSNRITVEQCWSLDVFRMTRSGVFKAGPGNLWSQQHKNNKGEVTDSFGYWLKSDHEGHRYLEMVYSIIDRNTKESLSYNYPINLTTTPCNFGGVRYWFICPLVKNNQPCMQRVGKLYLPPGCRYFGCRHCYNLTYKCQKEHDKTFDAFVKNPLLMLSKLQAGSATAAIAALKAWGKLRP